MSESIAIRVEALHKHFGRRQRKRVNAVCDLNLEVAAGQVYGFLGPNGAGKTTTIRMLLDLTRPDHGDVFLFGRHVRRERDVLGRVGSLVEGAAFYDFLTGRRNLEVLALTSGLDLPRTRFDEVLDLVGMRDDSQRRVKGYSTGMKQRLGIGAAMLTDPDLLILDEPANGLDPHGINEVRALTRRLVDERGKTVFLSSHQLGEVEKVCDRVAIIDRGRLTREGALTDLVSETSGLWVEAEPLDRAAAIITSHWPCVPDARGGLRVQAAKADIPEVVRRLVNGDVQVLGVSAHRRTLEDYFLSVTEAASMTDAATKAAGTSGSVRDVD
jgi:ABC-2 type transport system ATP-binding protein